MNRDIDELAEASLKLELKTRKRKRRSGVCDYCGRRPETATCKYPSRHSDPRIRRPVILAKTIYEEAMRRAP